jgi:hypothetical protein
MSHSCQLVLTTSKEEAYSVIKEFISVQTMVIIQ